jgi:hypothetical protein
VKQNETPVSELPGTLQGVHSGAVVGLDERVSVGNSEGNVEGVVVGLEVVGLPVVEVMLGFSLGEALGALHNPQCPMPAETEK